MSKHIQLLDAALGVTTSQRGSECQADADSLPGSPPIGTGINGETARADLYAHLLIDVVLSNPGEGYGDIIARLIREEVR